MDKVLLITYELKDKSRDYTKFYKALEALPDWWHYIDNCWMVKTNERRIDLLNRLKKYVSEEDMLIILDITGDAFAGSMPDKAWEWYFFQRADKTRVE